MSVGENIKNKRKSMGMTQDEVVTKVGISQSMLCQIENGIKNPTIPLCKALAEVFGCKVSELVD